MRGYLSRQVEHCFISHSHSAVSAELGLFGSTMLCVNTILCSTSNNGKQIVCHMFSSFLVIFSGPRSCAGEPLAKMELFLVFSNLLQRFSFCREVENVGHSLESIIGRVTNAPKEYKLRAYCRSE